MVTRNLSKIIDPNGDEYLIKAKGLENQINISLDGEVTGSATTDLSGNVTISGTAIGNGAVTTGKIADSAVTLEKIADSAKSGSVSDNDGKLATHEQVKSAIDALDSAKTSTDGANVQVKVTEVDGKISAVNITADNTASAPALATEAEARAYADTALDTRLTSAESDIDNLESAVDAMYNSEVAGTTDEINVSSSTSGKVKTFVVSLANAIKTKINAAYDHINDSVKHITDTERTDWNDAYAHSNTEGNPHGTTIEEINGLRSELTEIESDVAAIEELIPSEATPSNQLADKAFVNSSVTSNTATFRGTSAEGLTEAQFLAWADALTKSNNDYVFWNTVDESGNVVYKRYKYNGSSWAYEFSLNNSSFTAVQWAAINSGITETDVDDIGYNTAARHSHSNKNLLDSYTQSNDSLVDAVSKKHSHSNKTVLDNTTASFTTADETKLDGIEAGAQVNLPVDTALSDNSTNPVQNKAVKAALDGKAGLADDNKFTGENWFENITRFSTSTGIGHLIRVFPSVGSGTNYSNWPEEYKDGNHFREWALRFPSGVDFWGKIRITLCTSWSNANASGVMQKSINVAFNKSTIYNNGGYYNDLGIHTEEEFRISELVWNSSENCWEIRFHSIRPTSNNGLTVVIVEFFTYNAAHANLMDDIYFADNTAYITTDTSYTASGVGVVSWATKPVFQTPYGKEVFDLSKTLAIANGGTGSTTAAGARTNLGLGNVENESVSDGTPDFTEATTRTNIDSGEKMSTLFGKIKKWFTDLKTVAFTGSYNDLIDKPTIPTGQVQSDWNETGTSEPSFIKNKPQNLVQDANYVHTDNNYTTTEKTKLSGIASGAEVNIQSDWAETNTASDAYIKNKPTIPPAITVDSALSDTSTNPVQNKVVKSALDGKADKSTIGDFRTKSQHISMGANLVVNGNGRNGDNYNFTSFKRYPTIVTNGAACSFGFNGSVHQDEYMSCDFTKKILFSVDIKNLAVQPVMPTHRIYIEEYDIDKNTVQAINVMYGVGTLTELTQDLKPGDTVVHLQDLSNSNWKSATTYHRGFIFWNYKNSFGYQYEPETYSRNVYPTSDSNPLWEVANVDQVNNTITLNSPWSGPLISAGTKVSRRSSGNTFPYPASESFNDLNWHHLVGTMNGVASVGTSERTTKFSQGVAYFRVGVYPSNISVAPTTDDRRAVLANLMVYELPDVSKGINGTLPIANGGTGATTASAARTNLDVYSKGEVSSTYFSVRNVSQFNSLGRVLLSNPNYAVNLIESQTFARAILLWDVTSIWNKNLPVYGRAFFGRLNYTQNGTNNNNSSVELDIIVTSYTGGCRLRSNNSKLRPVILTYTEDEEVSYYVALLITDIDCIMSSGSFPTMTGSWESDGDVLGYGIKGDTNYSLPEGWTIYLDPNERLGQSNTATKLETAHTIQTNLGSTSSAYFDGSANVTPGVTGTLPIANGGTGATTAANTRTNLDVYSKGEIDDFRKLVCGTPGYASDSLATSDLYIQKLAIGGMGVHNKGITLKAYTFVGNDESNTTLVFDSTTLTGTDKDYFEKGIKRTYFTTNFGESIKFVWTGDTNHYFRALALHINSHAGSGVDNDHQINARFEIGGSSYEKSGMSSWGNYFTFVFNSSQTTANIYLVPAKPTNKMVFSGARSLTTYGDSDKVLNGTSLYTYALNASRNLKVNLASESAQSFDGSANAESIGVTGTLPITHGGTGATTAANARTNLDVYSMGEVDTALSTAIADEAAAREAGDLDLLGAMDSKIYDHNADVLSHGDIRTALSAEASARSDADTDLGGRIDSEESGRQQADRDLQAQIDAISSKSDVVDVVASYAELVAYDTSTLFDNDVIKVLRDETQDDAESYYRWNETTWWQYIGSQGPFVTPAEMHTALNDKVDKVTGKGLSTNDYTDAEKNKLAGIEAGANKTVVDSSLSSSSTNPVQNKVVKAALDGKADVINRKDIWMWDNTFANDNCGAGQYSIHNAFYSLHKRGYETSIICQKDGSADIDYSSYAYELYNGSFDNYDIKCVSGSTTTIRIKRDGGGAGTNKFIQPAGGYLYGKFILCFYSWWPESVSIRVYRDYPSQATPGWINLAVNKNGTGYFFSADNNWYNISEIEITIVAGNHTNNYPGVSELAFISSRPQGSDWAPYVRKYGRETLYDDLEAPNFVGNLDGKLKTARNLKVNLASESAQSFDGSANAESIGVAGTLPITHGGTGATTAAEAQADWLNDDPNSIKHIANRPEEYPIAFKDTDFDITPLAGVNVVGIKNKPLVSVPHGSSDFTIFGNNEGKYHYASYADSTTDNTITISSNTTGTFYIRVVVKNNDNNSLFIVYTDALTGQSATLEVVPSYCNSNDLLFKVECVSVDGTYGNFITPMFMNLLEFRS